MAHERNPRPNQFTRRAMLRFAAGVVGAGALGACGAAPAQPAASQPEASSQPEATSQPGATAMPQAAGDSVIPQAASGGLLGEIVLGIQAGPEADAHTRLVSRFAKATGDKLTLRVEEVGRDVWDSRWLTNFQSKSDAWDVVNVQSGPFKLAGPAGFVQPLNDFMDDPQLLNKQLFDLADWPKALLDLFTIGDKLYALPQEASTLMFYYRSDLVEKWGLEPPDPQGYSWEALIDNCRKAQAKIAAEKMTDVYPLLLGVKTAHSAIHFQQMAWSYGAELFTDNKMPNFDSPEAVASLENAVGWLMTDKLVSPGMVGYEYPEVLTAYQQGKAVFALQWNAAAPDILNPEKSPASAGKTAFSVYPWQPDKGAQQIRLWPSVWSVGVSAFSKKQKEAFEYCAWFTSKEVARDYVMNGGGSSGRGSLLTDAEILKTNPQYPAMLEGFKVYHTLPDLVSYNYLLNNVLPAHLQGVWQGTTKAKDALTAATEEAKKYLSEKGEI